MELIISPLLDPPPLFLFLPPSGRGGGRGGGDPFNKMKK